MDKVHYCERFIELMIDLEVRLPASRFHSVHLNLLTLRPFLSGIEFCFKLLINNVLVFT